MKLTTFCLIACASLATAELPPHPAPSVTTGAEGTSTLEWTGQSGITYFIQYSLDLQTWSYMPVIESGDGTPVSYGFESNTARMFLRLHYTDIPTSNPNSDDFDGDGISNWDEIRPGGTATDPFKWDTAGDGHSDYFTDNDGNLLPDGWEIQHYGAIGVANPNADPDNDGLTNAQEIALGRDPHTADVMGPVNVGLGDAPLGEPVMSFRNENHPSDLYYHDDVPGWEAVEGDHIEIWDEGDGNPYVELQAHWGAHGIKQEFPMLA